MDTAKSFIASTVLISLGIVVHITFEGIYFVLFELVREFELVRLYGSLGIVVWLFGSRNTWRLQAQVLGKVKEEDAFSFKKSVTDECTMVSVAAALVAQINVTALSLNLLSETHWVARGFIVWSLISSLMAVYYATRQQRSVGRLLEAKRIRQWIRGGSDTPSLYTMLKTVGTRDPANVMIKIAIISSDIVELFTSRRPPGDRSNISLSRLSNFEHVRAYETKCDPEEFFLPARDGPSRPLEINLSLKQKLMDLSFTPSVASVITVSAPQILLSVAVFSLLIALGIYFGFTWTRNLDTNAGPHDSRNVFVFYIVGLGVCIIVYSISGIIQDGDKRTERRIIEQHCNDWLQNHEDCVRGWGYTVVDMGRERKELAGLEPPGSKGNHEAIQTTPHAKESRQKEGNRSE